MVKKVNKILENHAMWLWQNEYYEKAIDCIKDANSDMRSLKGFSLRKRTFRDKKGRYDRAPIYI